MNVLVLNCGSSSVRFQVIETDPDLIKNDTDRCLAKGYLERIGSLSLVTLEAMGKPKRKETVPLRDHRAALDRLLRWIVSPDSGIQGIRSLTDLNAVGHRVVHGGERFTKSVLNEPAVIGGIEETIELAPLHNPANLKGILAARELLGPDVPQVAVFDTAFHATMPETAYLYPLPYSLYGRHKLRRYGFHGTSHRYVSFRYRQMRNIAKEEVNLVTMHLGNGCSACAIRGGDSINTSMGLTPLEGLVMGTRCGSIDPAIVMFLNTKGGMSIDEIDTMLNKQSGLLGVSGLTNDMRELLHEERENGDRRARLAIEIFCARARQCIGAYVADMGGADAVVFTGGIGENAAPVRERICKGLECLGLEFDKDANNRMIGGKEGAISSKGSRLQAYVIPTNEELLIARDTVLTVMGVPAPSEVAKGAAKETVKQKV